MTVAQRKIASFTLIELLAVITVIAMLAAIVMGMAGYAKQKSNISRTKAEVVVIGMAIESFKIDHGQYPTSSIARATGVFSGGGTLSPVITNGSLLYLQLVTPKSYYNFKPAQLLVYTNSTTIIYGTGTQTFNAFTCLIDPWGHPYNYYRTYPVQTDQVNQTTFDLWSCGPNGANENGGGDDISNWRR